MRKFIFIVLFVQFLAFSVSAIERPQIVNNTFVADDGTTRLRGGTLWLYGWISDKTTWALSDAPWTAMQENKLNVVRVACAYRPETSGNYTLDQYEGFLDNIINRAEAAGIYVVIDYHPSVGHFYDADAAKFDIQKQNARDFWGRIAPRYKDRKNVIYELVNEPVFDSPNDYLLNNEALIREFEALWSFCDSLAPSTPKMVFTFCRAGSSASLTDWPKYIVGRTSGIDWSKTVVAFHSYWDDNSTHMVDLKNNYPCMNTEFMLPITGSEMRTLDGDSFHAARMEELGISWMEWDILDNQSNLSRLNQIIHEIKARGLFWGVDTSTSAWQSFDVSVQTGKFKAEFDAVPNGDGIYAVTAIQNGTLTMPQDIACGVLFDTDGTIQVRNGDLWSKTTTVTYSSGTKYHFRMEIDLPGHTYSVYVTPQGQSEVTLATNFAFSTEQSSVTQLTGWGFKADSGSHAVSNMTFTGETIISAPATSTAKWQSFQLSTQTGTFTAEFDVVPTLDGGVINANVSIQNGTMTKAQDGSCMLLFYNNMIQARKAASWVGSVASISGKKYHFRMEIDVPAHTYSIYVTPEGGVEEILGTNFAFRNDTPAPVTQLTGWGLIASTGSITVSNMTFPRFQVVDTEAPSIPNGLASSSITPTSFTLDWTASTDSIGVTGYEVFKDGVSIGTTTSTSMAVSGLTASTAYAMTVRARDAAGNWSAQSTALSVTTAVATDTQSPGVPDGLVSSSIASTSFILSWTASTDNVGVTGYEVFKNGTLVGTSATASISVTGLTAATTYSMTVRAGDADGNWSAQSAALSVATAIATVPPVTSTSKWQSFQLSTQTGTFKAEFDVVPTFADDGTANANVSIQNGTMTKAQDGSCMLLFYNNKIQARKLTAWTGNVASTSGTKYHFRMEINIPAHTYSIYVTPDGGSEETLGTDFAFRSDTPAPVTQLTGWGLIASIGSIAVSNVSFKGLPVVDTDAPSVPAELASSGVTETGFTLSWTASTDNVGVTGYEVFKDGTSLGTSATASMSVTGLTAETTYSMTVRARDAAGNWSAQSAALSVTPTTVANDTQAPGVPTGLASGTDVTQTSFTLSWTASTDNVGVTGYEVFKDGVSVGTSVTTTMNVAGLTAGTTYAMTVRARDAAGNWSAQSTALNVTTSVTSGGDVTSTTVMQSFTIGPRTGTFTVEFDAVPNNSGTEMLGYVAIQDGTASSLTDFACAVRFTDISTSLLYALNGGTTYAKSGSHIYTAGVNHHFRLVIDLTTHTYNPYVSVGGNPETLIKGNCLFGNGKESLTQITGWSLVSPKGSLTVSNMTFSGGDTEVPSVPTGLASSSITETSLSLSWTASTDNVGVTGYEVFKDGTSIGTTATASMPVTGLTAGTAYSMTVRARDEAGNWSAQSTALSVTTNSATGIDDLTSDNSGMLLSYPNPFNMMTNIQYTMAGSGFVSLKVYDEHGREVAILVNEHQQAGPYTTRWSASGLPEEVYFAKLTIQQRDKDVAGVPIILTKKILLMK